MIAPGRQAGRIGGHAEMARAFGPVRRHRQAAVGSWWLPGRLRTEHQQHLRAAAKEHVSPGHMRDLFQPDHISPEICGGLQVAGVKG